MSQAHNIEKLVKGLAGDKAKETPRFTRTDIEKQLKQLPFRSTARGFVGLPDDEKNMSGSVGSKQQNYYQIDMALYLSMLQKLGDAY